MFYIADATRDGTTGGSEPFWADSREEAQTKAFDYFKSIWPSVFEGSDYADWDDFRCDCDGSSLYTCKPIEALAHFGLIGDVPAAQARAMIEKNEALPIGKILAASDPVAVTEPLPTALFVIDQLIDMGGDVAFMARIARKAVLQVVHAATEVHALLGEAMERHIYDFDNGDTIQPDCQFQKGMDALQAAFAGKLDSFYSPESPLPWRLIVSDAFASIQADDGSRTGIPDRQLPTLRDIADLTAVVEAVNCRPCLQPVPEVCIVLDSGIIQHIVTRNAAPVIIHSIDYAIDGVEPEDLTAIPQVIKPAAPAILERWSTDTASPEFWAAVEGAK